MTLEGISGREKFAFLPHNFGKYDSADYWDLDVKKSAIVNSLKQYLAKNGIKQENIVNIDLSSFPSRYNFKK